ncbi:MAG: hypothetical protein JO227_21010 [Acetobacteraceae bacterium]|nr:hypothetical protein [Acetobacteraceae bacterium]
MSNILPSLRIAELLCARMSHDLSGIAGVLSGTLELAAEELSDNDESMAFAVDAARDLVNRLRLLRAAWGPANEPLDVNTLRSLSGGVGKAKVVVRLEGIAPGTVFPAPMGRVLLNLLLLAADSLPGGGTVAVSSSADEVTVAISGARAAWPPGLPACLASHDAAWEAVQDARSVQMPLTALLAHSSGLQLSLVPGPDGSASPSLRVSL